MRPLLSSVGAFLASISALPFSHPEVSKRLEDGDDEPTREQPDDRGDERSNAS